MNTIKIISVNRSNKKGIKHPTDEIVLSATGILGDIHEGSGNRQISIINIDDEKKDNLNFGEFGENINITGLANVTVRPFDLFKIGDALLEVTLIGKKAHDTDKESENSIMHQTGIFCRVKKRGIIKKGDYMDYIPKSYHALVITLSDRADKGEYEDRSGPAIQEQLKGFFEKNNLPFQISSSIIPDDAILLNELISKATVEKTDIIITTGGTGIGKRDITVETVQPRLDKEIPGIMEMIRIKYGSEKPNALLSRGVAGVIDDSLVYTLPGSVKAVNEYMVEITKTLSHLFYMLHGIDSH